MLKKSGGKIRIIGGIWKRSTLQVLDLDGLRPTGNRQREMLFNWLSSRIDTPTSLRTLDLFAGTGALSFEAASRGFKECILIEKNPVAARVIRNNIDKLQAQSMKLKTGNALELIGDLPGLFDIIFIDPPFALDLHVKILPLAVSKLSKNGFIYLESPHFLDKEIFDQLELEIIKQEKNGNTTLTLVQKK